MQTIYCLYANVSVIQNQPCLGTADGLEEPFHGYSVLARSWLQLL